MSLWAPFIQGVGNNFPLASLTFDNFHVMKIVNAAVDEVRRAEQKERPELARTRYVWLKKPRSWTTRQREIFEQLNPKRLNLKTARAYHPKLTLWALPTDLAKVFLKSWYYRATHSRLEPMIEVARTVKRHWAGILRWSVSQISNGVLEAINSLVQAARARARGYRSTAQLYHHGLSHCGKASAQATHMK